MNMHAALDPARHLALVTTALLLPFTGVAQVFAPDTEPNNSFSTASPITLGVPFEGRLNVDPGDRFDLYSFVLPDDGVLLLDVESEQSGAAVSFLTIRGYALQDTVNTMPGVAYPDMGSFGTVIQDDAQIHCMKAGLHYLRVGGLLEDSTTTPRSYRITATHRPMAFANDPEPNNDASTAIPLAAGVWAEGRLSVEWPHNDPGDIFDQYRIHKTAMGPLVLQTEVAAEYENVLPEPAELFVHNADQTLTSGTEGYVGMGSQGVPASDIAIYPTLNDTGVFYVRLTNAPAYGHCYRFMWSVGSVGMAEGTASRSFAMAPNPAGQGFVHLLAPGMERVELVDAGGRIVQAPSTAHRDGLRLDVSGRPAGMYLVRVTFDDGRTATGHLAIVP